jgi:hypothetical protein
LQDFPHSPLAGRIALASQLAQHISIQFVQLPQALEEGLPKLNIGDLIDVAPEIPRHGLNVGAFHWLNSLRCSKLSVAGRALSTSTTRKVTAQAGRNTEPPGRILGFPQTDYKHNRESECQRRGEANGESNVLWRHSFRLFTPLSACANYFLVRLNAVYLTRVLVVL